jgi:DNA topoisomerase-1
VAGPVTIDGEVPTKGNIALTPADPDALVVEGGDPAGALHVTVKFIGELDRWDDEARQFIEDAVKVWAAQLQPIEATVTKVGPLGDEGAMVLFLDAPGLDEARAALSDMVDQTAERIGADTTDTYPTFTAHLTVGYDVDPPDDMVGRAILLDGVQVQWATDTRDFPLGDAKVAATRKRDGDGDGFVDDGLPTMRPYNPATDLIGESVDIDTILRASAGDPKATADLTGRADKNLAIARKAGHQPTFRHIMESTNGDKPVDPKHVKPWQAANKMVYDHLGGANPAPPEGFTSEPLQRGLNVELPPELAARLREATKFTGGLPRDEDPTAVADDIVAYLRAFKGHQGDERYAGIGNNYTNKPDLATRGAMTGTGTPIVLTARHRPGDVETDPNMMRDMASGEGETRLQPGSAVEVDTVRVKVDGSWHDLTPTKKPEARPTADLAGAVFSNGGFTYDPIGDQFPTEGVAVAVPGHSVILTEDAFRADAATAIADYLRQMRADGVEDLMIGGWHDKEHGEVVLDRVEVVETRDEAMRLGADRGEQAVFDLATLEEIPTGGTGGRENIDIIGRSDPVGDGPSRETGEGPDGRGDRPDLAGSGGADARADGRPEAVADPHVEKWVLGDWEQSQPWNLSRADIEGGALPWLKMGKGRGTELASQFDDGTITVTPSWFDLTPESRRHTLYHESGHRLSDITLGVARDTNGELVPSGEVDAFDAFKLARDPDRWVPSGGTPGEMAAEAYGMLHSDPQSFADREPEIRDWIIRQADANGFPVPQAARDATPRKIAHLSNTPIADRADVPVGTRVYDKLGDEWITLPDGAAEGAPGSRYEGQVLPANRLRPDGWRTAEDVLEGGGEAAPAAGEVPRDADARADGRAQAVAEVPEPPVVAAMKMKRDGDGDGMVDDGTPLERPVIPGFDLDINGDPVKAKPKVPGGKPVPDDVAVKRGRVGNIDTPRLQARRERLIAEVDDSGQFYKGGRHGFAMRAAELTVIESELVKRGDLKVRDRYTVSLKDTPNPFAPSETENAVELGGDSDAPRIVASGAPVTVEGGVLTLDPEADTWPAGHADWWGPPVAPGRQWGDSPDPERRAAAWAVWADEIEWRSRLSTAMRGGDPEAIEYLSAVAAATRETLDGVDSVRLYRGTTGGDSGTNTKRATAGGLRPPSGLTSWTMDPGVAARFGEVAVEDVPVDRIVSFDYFGRQSAQLGLFSEHSDKGFRFGSEVIVADDSQMVDNLIAGVVPANPAAAGPATPDPVLTDLLGQRGANVTPDEVGAAWAAALLDPSDLDAIRAAIPADVTRKWQQTYGGDAISAMRMGKGGVPPLAEVLAHNARRIRSDEPERVPEYRLGDWGMPSAAQIVQSDPKMADWLGITADTTFGQLRNAIHRKQLAAILKDPEPDPAAIRYVRMLRRAAKRDMTRRGGTVTLYRADTQFTGDPYVTKGGSGLSSWTTDYATAAKYAGGGVKVHEVDVPADRVLAFDTFGAMASTGFYDFAGRDAYPLPGREVLVVPPEVIERLDADVYPLTPPAAAGEAPAAPVALAAAVDGDGDGFVNDGTPQMRPVGPGDIGPGDLPLGKSPNAKYGLDHYTGELRRGQNGDLVAWRPCGRCGGSGRFGGGVCYGCNGRGGKWVDAKRLDAQMRSQRELDVKAAERRKWAAENPDKIEAARRERVERTLVEDYGVLKGKVLASRLNRLVDEHPDDEPLRSVLGPVLQRSVGAKSWSKDDRASWIKDRLDEADARLNNPFTATEPEGDSGEAVVGVPFADLPSSAKGAVLQWVSEGDVIDPAEHVNKFVYDVEVLPIEEAKRRAMQVPDIAADFGDDWAAYHAAYMALVPDDPRMVNPPGERWGVITSPYSDEFIIDGWHRLHRFVRDGEDDITVVQMRPKPNPFATVDAPGELGYASSSKYPGMRPVTTDERKELRVEGRPIPPAWTDLYIALDPDTPMQVRGKDAKGRFQYIYTTAHHEQAAAAKFARTKELAKRMPELDAAIERDAMDDPAAAATALIRHFGLRPGSTSDTKAKKKAYGATTLQARHVRQYPETGRTTLSFVGKSGVKITVSSRDPDIYRIVERWLGDKEGTVDLFPATDANVRAYIDANLGDGFKAKDLRTHLANVMALDMVSTMRRPTTQAKFKAARNKVADAVAKALGNTRTVTLSNYINPTVFAAWEGALPA